MIDAGRKQVMNMVKDSLSTEGYVPIGDLERSCLYAYDYGKKAHLTLTKKDEFFDVAIKKVDNTYYSMGFYFRLKNPDENCRDVHHGATSKFNKINDAEYNGSTESNDVSAGIGEIVGYYIILNKPKEAREIAQSISQTVQGFYENVSPFGIELRNSK